MNTCILMNIARTFSGVLICAFMTTAPAFAQVPATITRATPNIYDVTVKELLLCTDVNCSTSTTLSNQTATFSLASGGAPSTNGQPYAINREIQVTGTYTHMRVVVDSTITVSGTVTGVDNSGGGTMTCTTTDGTAGNSLQGNFGAFGDPGTNGVNSNILVVGENQTEQSLAYVVTTIPTWYSVPSGLDMTISGSSIINTFTLPTPLTANAGDILPEYDIKFLVTDGLAAMPETIPDTCVMFIFPPSLRFIPR